MLESSVACNVGFLLDNFNDSSGSSEACSTV
jgi:hypothetical protein